MVTGGRLILAGGNLNALGTLTIDDVTLHSLSNLSIGTSLLINNTLNWTGRGTISGGILNLPGTTTVSGDSTGADNRFLNNVIVNNTGTFNFAPSSDDDLVLNNGNEGIRLTNCRDTAGIRWR